MRDDRESEHTDGDCEADGDRVFDDVFGKTVFDAFGVMFESKDETRETDTSEVQKGHFDGAEWVAEGEDDEDYGENGSVDGFGEEERGGAFEVVDRLATFVND